MVSMKLWITWNLWVTSQQTVLHIVYITRTKWIHTGEVTYSWQHSSSLKLHKQAQHGPTENAACNTSSIVAWHHSTCDAFLCCMCTSHYLATAVSLPPQFLLWANVPQYHQKWLCQSQQITAKDKHFGCNQTICSLTPFIYESSYLHNIFGAAEVQLMLFKVVLLQTRFREHTLHA
jgi:hypothetical protein